MNLIIRFFTLFIIFCSTHSLADYKWEKVSTNIQGDVFYIDTSSIKKVGNNAYYFRLADYIIPNNNGELSAIIYFETNCNDLSFRYLRDNYFMEPMGRGEPSTIYNEKSEWQSSKKGSSGESIRKFVCQFN